MRSHRDDIVITGVGVVSPFGVGTEGFLPAMLEGRSGIHRLSIYDDPSMPVPIGGEVVGFDGKQYIRPRKAMKVMSRDIQLAFTAAELAAAQAGVGEHRVDPERLGVVFGGDLIPCDLEELAPAFRKCLDAGQFQFDRWGPSAMSDMYPLWMLKYLPNMSACHVAIAQDARGPNNTMTMGEVSSLAAISEAARVLSRGSADVMFAGAASSRIHPMLIFRGVGVIDFAPDREEVSAVCRPFDAHRRGTVYGEGGAVFVLEKRGHAEARGATPLAQILGYNSAFEPVRHGATAQGDSIRRAISAAMAMAKINASDVGHYNAHGESTIEDDRREAMAVRDVLPNVPVTAPKAYVGNLGAAGGAIELAVSVLSFADGAVPALLNYQTPDPACPIRAIGPGPTPIDNRVAVKVNHTRHGQAVALVVAAP